MTDIVLYAIPWYSLPLAAFTGWALSVFARWLLRRFA